MDQQTKTKIKKLSSDIEKLLFKEIETQLLRLGITKEKFLEESRLQHLSNEEKIIRAKIIAFINHLRYISSEHPIRFHQFLRESVFVWINRLIGIKCMESRGLILDESNEITEIITTRPKYGNLSKKLRDFRSDNPERARDKDGGLMLCLKETFNQLSSELGFVFDPIYEPGLVIPRYNIIREIISIINNTLNHNIYSKDDFLGWVYQYFDEDGKQSIYDRLSSTARNKLRDHEISAYSQLYTEHFIVEFIVQNTLGMWWQHKNPNSKVLQKWEYFLTDIEEKNKIKTTIELKEVKILDPACGSGHFLLNAFDRLYELYLEEGKIPREEIPRYIIENNLYGVDIDRRAAQLASLSLYLKAKELNPNLEICKINLYSTDIIFQNKDLLGGLKKRFKVNIEEQELIESIWRGMRDVSVLGSLLPVEQEVEKLLKSKRKTIDQYVDLKKAKWAQWKEELLENLNQIIMEARQKQDPNQLIFARDGVRGLNFLEVFRNRYDIIIMNPPYINSRRMNKNYKENLKKLYGKNYYDTSACFIQRAIGLLKKNGILGGVYPHTLSFLKNFVSFRKMLLDNLQINCYVNLGNNAFFEIRGAAAARFISAIMILTKGIKGNTLYINSSTEGSVQSKLKKSVKNESYKIIKIDSFLHIEEIPFLFDTPNEIVELFTKYPSLNSEVKIKTGLQTSDNDRFVRYIWEVRKDKIGLKWFPFLKGGGKIRWFGEQKFLINWEKNGRDLKKFQRSVIRNEEFYFKEGITYSALGYYMCARYLPSGNIFEVNGPCIFSDEYRYSLLSYLNSSLGEFILRQINPSVATQVGYLGRLPVSLPDGIEKEYSSSIARKCVDIQNWTYQFRIKYNQFKHTGINYILREEPFKNLNEVISTFYTELEEKLIQKLIYEVYLDNQIYELYKISSETRETIKSFIDTRVGGFPLIKSYIKDNNSIENDVKVIFNSIAIIDLNMDNLNKLTESIKKSNPFEDLSPYEKIAKKFRVNPISVAKIRQDQEILPEKFTINLVEDFLTELIFQIVESDEDGIIPLGQNTTEKSLEWRLLTEFEKLVGEDKVEELKRDLQDILGKSIAKWLDRDFFKRHLVQFEKRPPIWHICSPANNFGCYLYYLKLTKDSASKIKFNYLRPEIDYHRKLIKDFQDLATTQGIDLNAKNKKETEIIENRLDDLNKFNETLEKLINMNYNPDIDDGIKFNLRPWQDLQLLASKKVIKY